MAGHRGEPVKYLGAVIRPPPNRRGLADPRGLGHQQGRQNLHCILIAACTTSACRIPGSYGLFVCNF